MRLQEVFEGQRILVSWSTPTTATATTGTTHGSRYCSCTKKTNSTLVTNVIPISHFSFHLSFFTIIITARRLLLHITIIIATTSTTATTRFFV
jgi:hypothetical protein